MKTILSAHQMRLGDRKTIEYYGVPSAVLMERAALAVVDVVAQHIGNDSRVLVFVGTGNNGGDGVCIARILHTKGIKASILLCGDEDKYSDDLKEQLEVADKYGVEKIILDDVDEYEVFIDAIFGIGLSRDVTGHFAECIKAYNDARGLKVAVDIASGINTDTGAVMGCACKCDITVTFNYVKSAHLLYPGREYCGDVYVRDIGITDYSLMDDKPNMFCHDDNDLALLDNRGYDTNKGDFGKVLIIAGSDNMCGAAYLSAKATLRMGAGLVKVYTTEKNAHVLQTNLPEAIVSSYDKYDEAGLIKELEWSTQAVIGPGIGQGEIATAITKYVIKNYDKPLVIDADALNIISKDTSMLDEPIGDRIITPHLGEMARLSGMHISQIKEDRVTSASDFADRYGVTVVQKSAFTVTAIPGGTIYINTTGNNGMSTAGSGDVLTGIIAGLIAGGISSDIAASLGVYIHGLCGDKAVEDVGKASLIASDIIDTIGKVLRG